MKLSIFKTTYLVEDNIITCIINYKIKLNDGLTKTIYSSKGIARCNNEDKFDFETGKKIALARAESNAYKYHKKICNKHIATYESRLKELNSFKDKAIACIEHNDGYIKNLSK